MFSLTVAQAAPKVVASIAPIHSIAASIMQGVGEPELLLDSILSPHGFSLKPSQARSLQQAELVIWVGEAIETPLAKPIQTLVQEANVLSLLPYVYANSNQPMHDPHIWLDPQAAVLIANQIAAKLAMLDAANEVKYRQNAIAFKASMQALERELTNGLKPLDRRPFMAFHDAYQPFVARFNLKMVGAVRINHSIRPGAGTIAALRRTMEEGEIVCLTSEYGEDNLLIAVLLEGSSINTITLDPLGAKLMPGPGLYRQLMINLAIDLAKCLN
jgi:zinc transport system substrate-binding protein